MCSSTTPEPDAGPAPARLGAIRVLGLLAVLFVAACAGSSADLAATTASTSAVTTTHGAATADTHPTSTAANPSTTPPTTTTPSTSTEPSTTLLRGTTTAPTTTTTPPTTTAPTTTATATTTTTTSPAATSGTTATLLAAGDIAWCEGTGDEATAALLAERPGATVASLGDHAYTNGTPAEFADCYDPSWGAARNRTHPVPGNHDYHTSGATGYFGYFGAAAGEPGLGYYSYDLGSWHVVALNSVCSIVACGVGSQQEQWLRADLAAHTGTACTLAYWHHPRFSSGTVHGSSAATAALWQALDDFGADVVLSGHEHQYERFAPLDPSGAPDPTGMREFVVGTGGRSLYGGFTSPAAAGSEVRDASTAGVLELTLRPGGYDWRFVPVAGGSFTDAGTAGCR